MAELSMLSFFIHHRRSPPFPLPTLTVTKVRTPEETKVLLNADSAFGAAGFCSQTVVTRKSCVIRLLSEKIHNLADNVELLQEEQ